jgi:hypothetical protein
MAEDEDTMRLKWGDREVKMHPAPKQTWSLVSDAKLTLMGNDADGWITWYKMGGQMVSCYGDSAQETMDKTYRFLEQTRSDIDRTLNAGASTQKTLALRWNGEGVVFVPSLVKGWWILHCTDGVVMLSGFAEHWRAKLKGGNEIFATGYRNSPQETLDALAKLMGRSTC